MVRKGQKQRQRQQLALMAKKKWEAQQYLAGLAQMVFGNIYLLIHILKMVRYLPGNGPRDLVHLSGINWCFRETVFFRLPERIWWKCVKPRCPLDMEKGSNSWTNTVGCKVFFLRFFHIEEIPDQNSWRKNEETRIQWWKRYHDLMDSIQLPKHWRIDGYNFYGHNDVIGRKRNYLRRKNGGGGLK